MSRVCILGASLNTGNLGVSALACGAVTAALKAMPDAAISFLDYGYHPESQCLQVEEKRFSVELVNLRFSKKVWFRNNIARLLLFAVLTRALPKSWRARWLTRSKCMSAILKADLVGSVAGGDSFSDVYGLSRLVYVALPQILVLQLGKPLILLPQTLGPFKGRLARAIGRYIMGRATLVCARDRQSLVEATALMEGRPWKPRFAHDMAFVMSAAGPSHRVDALIPQKQEGVPLIGINVSGLLLMGGYTRKNMFGLKLDYAQLIQRVIEFFVDREGANVLLVPHVFGADPENDVDACRAIYDRLAFRMIERLHLVGASLDQHEIKYAIGRCDFFISSRMHACIAALSQSIPAVSLAYSGKFAGVMNSLKVGELVVDLREFDEESALRRVREQYDRRRQIHHELAARMPGVKNCVFDVFREQRCQSDYRKTSEIS